MADDAFRPPEPVTPARAAPTPRATPTARAAPFPGARARGATPDLGQRAAQIALAWAPVAAAVGWGGPIAAGCGPDGPACPVPLVAALILMAILAAAVFVTFPILARIGALATVGGLAVAAPLALTAAAVGLLPPAPPIVAGALVLIGVGYLGAGTLAAAHALRHWGLLIR